MGRALDSLTRRPYSVALSSSSPFGPGHVRARRRRQVRIEAVAKKASSKRTTKGSRKATSSKVASKSAGTKTAAKKAVKKIASKPAASVAKKSRASRKAKSPLTAQQLRQFRKMLLEKRHDLIGDMNDVEAGALGVNRQEGSGDLSNMPTHPADIGTDSYEQEFSLGLLESERVLLGDINDALERIDRRSYGVCLGTGKPIARARLNARPWAKYGIEYARLIEKGLAVPPDETDEDEED